MESRPHLEVHTTALCIGPESIGLPTVRSVDAVFDAYSRLVARLRQQGQRFELRSDDIACLAEATGLEPAIVRRRVQRIA